MSAETDPSRTWFWTERWQQMEHEADEEYAAGRYKTFDSVEAFLADLDAYVAQCETDEGHADSDELPPRRPA